jgi:hypothetical protein
VSDLFFGEFSTDVTPPEVTVPSPTGIDVPRNSDVEFNITDLETGVDPSSVVVTVGGTTVYSGGAFQNSWTGSFTDMGGGVWHMTAAPPAVFDSYSSYLVTVNGQDQAPIPNVMGEYSWSFTTEDDEAPYVDVGYSPVGPGTPTTALVQFDLKDDGVGVDLTAVIIRIGGVEAYNWDGVGSPNSGFKTGFNGLSSAVTAVSAPNHYQFVVDADPNYDEWTAHLVEVEARDLR